MGETDCHCLCRMVWLEGLRKSTVGEARSGLAVRYFLVAAGLDDQRYRSVSHHRQARVRCGRHLWRAVTDCTYLSVSVTRESRRETVNQKRRRTDIPRRNPSKQAAHA